MFGWVTRLCSSDSSSPFDTALNHCTYADWSVPVQQKIIYLIQCFQGKHNQIIRSQKAFLQFKTKFQQHQDKNNMAFRLKNLLVLDRCAQQMCILDTISHYQYNRLFYQRNKLETVLESQSLQQFVSAYYLYIKKKAIIYLQLPSQLFNRSSRKKFITNLSNLTKIFECIDKSIQIQKIINQTNETLKKVNKSPDLIQQILTYLLKTYIFAYSIVAMCLQTLLSKLKSLKNTQLTNLQKLLKYFKKQFTNNFLRFLQSNKTIDAFKNFQYSEILKIDQIYIATFQEYYKLKLQQQNSPQKMLTTPNTSTNDKNGSINTMNTLQASQFLNQDVKQLPESAFKNLNIEMKFSFTPRKVKIQQQQENKENNQFKKYDNYYHQNFIQDQKMKEIQLKNNQQSGITNFMNKKTHNSSIQFQQKRKDSENMERSVTKSQIKKLSKENMFNQSMWYKWNNIYSTD